jgi:PAS domain S-box-containing protein
MTSKPTQQAAPSPTQTLTAAAWLASLSRPSRPMRPFDERLRELQERQIELEIENEALRHRQTILEEARDRYLDLFDASPVGYLTVTGDATIREVNLAAAELLGVERTELLRRRFVQFVSLDDAARWQRMFTAALLSDEHRTEELVLRHVDGFLFYAQLDCRRINPQDDSLPVLRIVLTDISERKAVALSLANSVSEMAAEVEAKVLARSGQLRALLADLTLAEERERRELAQNLHDHIGQLLAAALLRLDAHTFAADLTALREVVSLVAEAEREVRALTLRLSPPIPQSLGLGLGPALRWLADEMERVYGMAVRVHDESDADVLVEPARTMMFRAVGELLTNVAKHARVQVADVSCAVEDHRLSITVSDDGCGFHAANVLDALPGAFGGLIRLRERFASLGCQMDIDSVPGDGTTVVLTVPIVDASEGQVT